jgi:hypothetical protein
MEERYSEKEERYSEREERYSEREERYSEREGVRKREGGKKQALEEDVFLGTKPRTNSRQKHLG